MAQVKFTKSVMKSIVSELEGFLKSSLFSSRRHNVRVLCKKVGMSHTTFYRQRRKALSLEKSTCPLSKDERDLILFWQRVEVLLSELRLKCRTCNLTSFRKELNSFDAEEARQAAVHQNAILARKQQSENRERRKRQQKIETAEQRTEQLTGGIGCFAFRFEKSRKNMF